MTDLIKCSRCLCRMLPKFFSANPKTDITYKTCDQCRESSKISTAKHKEKNKNRKFKCTQCDVELSTKTSLQNHVKGVHNKIKDFACETCGAKFTLVMNLRRHNKAIHLKIKNFSCEKCNYICDTQSTLSRHINIVHLKLKNHECKLCKYICSNISDLNRHVESVHFKIKTAFCEICEYKCFNNLGLKKHVDSIHIKIKNFSCETCDYKCVSKSSLNIHKKICTGKLNCSSGEYAIMKVLKSMKLDYTYDTLYELKSEKGSWLRWDFRIDDFGTQIFLEYDGAQHFKPVRFGGMSQEKAEMVFKKQQASDKLKDDFCQDKGYLLLRIPYTEFKNVNQIIVDFFETRTVWNSDSRN